MFNRHLKRIIITSGPTLEPIDPVRYISNRSSGKTGFYLVEEAKKREFDEIVFITGPTHLIPTGVKLIQIETAVEMKSKIFKHFNRSDVVIMAAAVSDFKSVKYYSEKIKSNHNKIKLEFVKNPDIIHELGQKKSEKQIIVGFAAETENVFENAIQKLNKKNLDLVILNEISDTNPGFEDDYNQIYLVTKNGIKKLERMKKSEMAVHIYDEIFKIRKEKKG